MAEDIEDLHIVPTGWLEETYHETSSTCWCTPVLKLKDKVTGRMVWVHNDYEQ